MDSFPLVSAVMPTRGRREFAQVALECFRSQTYPNKELVILDDAADPSFPEAPEGIRYYAVGGRLNIPQKRNMVNDKATGEILMHFDSDDWYAPERMETQVKLLLESGRAMQGFHSILFWHVEAQKAWRYKSVERPLAVGSSQVYRKSWWEQNRFNERTRLGSDTGLSNTAKKQAALVSHDGGALIVARIHGKPGKSGNGNSSMKSVGGPCYRPADRSQIPEAFFR